MNKTCGVCGKFIEYRSGELVLCDGNHNPLLIGHSLNTPSDINCPHEKMVRELTEKIEQLIESNIKILGKLDHIRDYMTFKL